MVKNRLRVPYGVYFTKIPYASTAPLWRPAGGRSKSYNKSCFLNFVRCPVKCRYSLKFHGARTRCFVGSIRVEWNQPGTGRSIGVSTHRTSTGRFIFLKIVRIERRPSRHRTRRKKLKIVRWFANSWNCKAAVVFVTIAELKAEQAHQRAIGRIDGQSRMGTTMKNQNELTW